MAHFFSTHFQKFTKGFSYTTSSSTFSADTNKLSHYTHNQVSEIENAKHNYTKHQLSEKEAELSKLTKHYEKLLNEAIIEHIKLSSSINKLTQELATEIDENAQSELALRRLEEKVETVQIDLKKEAKKNKALKNEPAIS